MKNLPISAGTVKEIDKQVEKVLRGLGNPEPPLDLSAVFELLKLDSQFYRSSEDGVVRETVSRIKVGAKLALKNPTRIWDAIAKLDLKALYIPEQRKILIDGNLHELKKRWNGAHEIGHDILEWHREYTFGDTTTTLSQSCHEQIEAEANYAAGRLLFMQGHFDARVKGRALSLKELNNLGKDFGNSWTSTLYRAVEVLDVPAFCIIGSHPRNGKSDRFRYFTGSASFNAQFSNFTQQQAQTILNSYCSFKTRGPLGSAEIMIEDDCNETHQFSIESFGIHQGDVLTFAQWVKKVPLIVTAR